MSENFLDLSRDERREALLVAAARSGRAAHLLEKDIWVVWVLRSLFNSAFGKDLVFKGGTSLSKAYQAIERFSEDVDLTYDIRAIAPDLVGDTPDAIPTSRSQQDRWTTTIRQRLPEWIEQQVSPRLREQLGAERLDAQLVQDGEVLELRYEPLLSGTGYVASSVILEFGARSTGEPHETKAIKCYAASELQELRFPEASPQVMLAERTFWEKATAVHVFCQGGRFRGPERFSRHWYDLVNLDRTGVVQRAIADRDLATHVARHKAMFFREKTATGELISYDAAVSGGLRLVPDGDALTLLTDDYGRMVNDGLLFTEPPTFAHLVESCQEIERRSNDAMRR